jgi:hypothetical protein
MSNLSMVEHVVAAYLDWLHDSRATSPRTLWLLFSAGAPENKNQVNDFFI